MWANREITLPEYRAARQALLTALNPPQPPTLPAWASSGLADTWGDLGPSARRRVAAAMLEAVIATPPAPAGDGPLTASRSAGVSSSRHAQAMFLVQVYDTPTMAAWLTSLRSSGPRPPGIP